MPIKNTVARWALMVLFCGIACDAEPVEEAPLAPDQVTEPAAEVGESRVEEDQFRASYECALEPEDADDDGALYQEREGDLYCLAKCEGYKMTRAVKERVDVEDYTDRWCEKRAKRFCKKTGRDFDKWCWGEREDEDDGDDGDKDDEDKDDEDEDDGDEDDNNN